ncbi:HNH endonuclease signature motif containing protein [Corynebacterium sp. HMSC04H06]|uniref:HNH endonuclease signature motif containing protein n=1 Tax=Corynebacterium sp. HMSC04H06 TaxID=1581050 RepID=UPI0008A3C34A|nr:HNH endonuclease signature motif containing protein [Corynebacterium sp. HMSC04H06]OFS22242.1 hypothetical protein HMPREF3067_04715 [Corynebacterium sp. HMSC04H06]
MDPYYTVNTPNCPIAHDATQIRRVDYHLWQRLRPPINEDCETTVGNLAARSGLSYTACLNRCLALERLETLPQLKETVERLQHIGFNYLTLIDQVLNNLGEPTQDVLERIDTELNKYLSPTRPGQRLPSYANLRRKLNSLVATEQPEDTPKESADTSGPDGGNYSCESQSGSRAGIYADYDPATTAQLDDAISRTAKERGISPAAALAGLILGEYSSPQVVLNLYQASDVPNAPIFVAGFGWISHDSGQKLADAATTVRYMSDIAEKRSRNYATPNDIKAFVNGRDGTCRYPGCTVKAERCQKDHCVDFEDGGPTAAYNLVNLCQHHHNIKTDGRATYVIDPHTSDVIWLFNDGTWQTTSPEGPISPRSCNWLRTVEQVMAGRRG